MAEEQPVPVIIRFVSVVGLISGLAGIVLWLPSVVNSGGFLSAYTIKSLIFYLVLAISSYGLRKMRRWAIVLFVLTVLYGIVIVTVSVALTE